jgi:hypothetical protein
VRFQPPAFALGAGVDARRNAWTDAPAAGSRTARAAPPLAIAGPLSVLLASALTGDASLAWTAWDGVGKRLSAGVKKSCRLALIPAH